ncbi:hypothetical protein F2Q68_00020161 [Brassica cretica]|uniref:SNF2 N-terminal domain-containing protein n=1 Tax=Brassica cretica TaxID=69181 RepID=A0A8S9FU85_BRACR|nr:hypothetical protein F2Q68_00020161 [Brassica cretica]
MARFFLGFHFLLSDLSSLKATPLQTISLPHSIPLNLRCSVANAAVAYFTFNSLRLGRAAQSVVGRLIRFWDSQNINKNEDFMGIMILLDELDRFEVACVAGHQFPNNLELMMGLFNCYVREYSFVKQQQTPIKMYKLAGEERFLLWAVCSIKLQSGEKQD